MDILRGALDYLWSWLKDSWVDEIALAIGAVSICYFCALLIRWLWRDPRSFGRAVFGHLALFFGIVALLWAAVLGEKHGWW